MSRRRAITAKLVLTAAMTAGCSTPPATTVRPATPAPHPVAQSSTAATTLVKTIVSADNTGPALANNILARDDHGSGVVASGGGNIVASGGGNVVADAGAPVVSQGGGNLTSNELDLARNSTGELGEPSSPTRPTNNGVSGAPPPRPRPRRAPRRRRPPATRPRPRRPLPALQHARRKGWDARWP